MKFFSLFLLVIVLIFSLPMLTFAQKGKVCKEPRPEMCTMDYKPVCGILADGSRKTYSNGCEACSDKNVVRFTKGECK